MNKTNGRLKMKHSNEFKEQTEGKGNDEYESEDFGIKRQAERILS